MDRYKKAHAAGKHNVGEAEDDISIKDYSICVLLVKIAVAVTLFAGLYQIVGCIIDGFEGLMRAAVINGANPFGWS